MLGKIKELFAGWSVWILAKKLVGRYIPVATAGAVAFFSKWAPESAQDTEGVKLAVGTLLWLILESARNLAVYAINKKTVKP